ncbi:hypothetical protein GBF38_021957 [Nibea albiflora]|uniref:Uncharacterized protein n=1 Tax=Nibea albiflora TaxID=240163 RepID=A0ACB7FHD1_NIBAL|nr:hypothetical protein GBF38_021957 [Nibea albiflora]
MTQRKYSLIPYLLLTRLHALEPPPGSVQGSASHIDPSPTGSRTPPARRDPRYSVQGVIAIIQNGESDVETEFDNTDASDEESDNNACVDKENQKPTDCPANMDTEPQSNKHVMPRDFDVYQGTNKGIRVKSEPGLSGDAVMKVASTLQNYKIYAANYFTSVPLVVKPFEHGIHYVGTARQRVKTYTLTECTGPVLHGKQADSAAAGLPNVPKAPERFAQRMNRCTTFLFI